ncbi:MAG: hypothetical protein Tsb0024_17260 [Ruegeria sp.]
MSAPGPERSIAEGPRPSVFLERQSYRRRRLADAARILPFLGAALVVIPLLWPRADVAGQGMPLSSAMLYIFISWAGMIGVSFLFGLAARRMAAREDASSESAPWRP